MEMVTVGRKLQVIFPVAVGSESSCHNSERKRASSFELGYTAVPALPPLSSPFHISLHSCILPTWFSAGTQPLGKRGISVSQYFFAFPTVSVSCSSAIFLHLLTPTPRRLRFLLALYSTGVAFCCGYFGSSPGEGGVAACLLECPPNLLTWDQCGAHLKA